MLRPVKQYFIIIRDIHQFPQICFRPLMISSNALDLWLISITDIPFLYNQAFLCRFFNIFRQNSRSCRKIIHSSHFLYSSFISSSSSRLADRSSGATIDYTLSSESMIQSINTGFPSCSASENAFRNSSCVTARMPTAPIASASFTKSTPSFKTVAE